MGGVELSSAAENPGEWSLQVPLVEMEVKFSWDCSWVPVVDKKPFIVVFYGGREVKGEQPGGEGTSASFNVGKTWHW